MKIIFIDDEINILNSLRRLMRRFHRDWECEYCSDPFQAVALFEERSFDLIISDMRMPGLNGSKVLEAAARLQPGTIRVILSGYSEPDSFLEASRWCHIFMPKPYDEQSIQDMLNRAVVLAEMKLRQEEKQRIGGISALPVLPEAYRKVDQLLNRDDFTAAQLGALISQEPVILAKIIQLANSAYFALSEPVVTAEDAVIALGTDVIRSLVLSIGVLSSTSAINEQNHRLFLNRSLSIASMAMQLAEAAGAERAQCEATFNAAMLYLLGKLVLISDGKLKQEQVRHYIDLAGEPLRHFENEQELCHSTDVTAYLLHLWCFPDSFITTITGADLYCTDYDRSHPSLWLHCAIAFTAADAVPLDQLFADGLLAAELAQEPLRSQIADWHTQLIAVPA